MLRVLCGSSFKNETAVLYVCPLQICIVRKKKQWDEMVSIKVLSAK